MMAVGKSPKSKKPPQTPQGSDLHSNNDKGDVLKDLSPLVEVQRKGKRAGIKRERCASYWDEDILREIGREGAVEGNSKEYGDVEELST